MLNYIRGEILSETKITEFNMHDFNRPSSSQQAAKIRIKSPPQSIIYTSQCMKQTTFIMTCQFEASHKNSLLNLLSPNQESSRA